MWYLAVALVVLAAAVLSIGVAFAGRQADKPAQLISQVDDGPLAGPPPAQSGPCDTAYVSLVPDQGAPANGGTTTVGDRFVLDLVAHTGKGNVTAAQSYMNFTYSNLQVANPSGADCVPSATVTSDPTMFDTELQNEVCNGPEPCTLRGEKVAAGSIAYAAGVLNRCPKGCSGDIRMAQIVLCATKAGDATIKWQFAPQNRQTLLVDDAGATMSQQACYADYKFSIKDK
jgi:hypothetical protein